MAAQVPPRASVAPVAPVAPAAPAPTSRPTPAARPTTPQTTRAPASRAVPSDRPTSRSARPQATVAAIWLGFGAFVALAGVGVFALSPALAKVDVSLWQLLLPALLLSHAGIVCGALGARRDPVDSRWMPFTANVVLALVTWALMGGKALYNAATWT